MKPIYGHDFYKDRHQETIHSARTVLAIILDVLPPVNSAVDFGCGVGTWLSVLREGGVAEVQGLDGPWVEQGLLVIPKQNFREVDFEEVIALDKKYDLAMTLEVAEHVSGENAHRFVESLVSASDFVLFSAAIPFQGGHGHVNEQWPKYWAELFERRGYAVLDFVRSRIWDDQRIPTWYRQNVLLFVRKERFDAVKVSGVSKIEPLLPMSLVHPDIYLSRAETAASLKGSWKLLRRALKSYVRRNFVKSS